MKKKQRIWAIPTATSLARAALDYLGRFAASEASLRRVLTNRLRRAIMRNALFAADNALQESLRQEIDRIIARHKNSGVLNDEVFAETKVNSLRRAGRSRRFIEQKLAQTGVKGDVVRNALHAADQDSEADHEFMAATRFARRRRLGKFRSNLNMAQDQLHKDLAALARSGFSLDTARRALGLLHDAEGEADDYGL